MRRTLVFEQGVKNGEHGNGGRNRYGKERD